MSSLTRIPDDQTGTGLFDTRDDPFNFDWLALCPVTLPQQNQRDPTPSTVASPRGANHDGPTTTNEGLSVKVVPFKSSNKRHKKTSQEKQQIQALRQHAAALRNELKLLRQQNRRWQRALSLYCEAEAQEAAVVEYRKEKN